MLLKNIMQKKHKKVIFGRPSTPINEVMDLLIENNIGCLPILGEDDSLTGIVSERDVLSRVNSAKGEYINLTAGDIMTTELIMGSPDENLSDIAGIMEKHKIRHLPIVEDKKVIGLISLWEIYKTRLDNMVVENRQLTHMLHSRDKTGEYEL
jgi:CBS domain-containing protein